MCQGIFVDEAGCRFVLEVYSVEAAQAIQADVEAELGRLDVRLGALSTDEQKLYFFLKGLRNRQPGSRDYCWLDFATRVSIAFTSHYFFERDGQWWLRLDSNYLVRWLRGRKIGLALRRRLVEYAIAERSIVGVEVQPTTAAAQALVNRLRQAFLELQWVDRIG